MYVEMSNGPGQHYTVEDKSQRSVARPMAPAMLGQVPGTTSPVGHGAAR